MAPSQMRDRNPFVAIGTLVVVLALVAGFGMRYGMNLIVAATCVVIAMVGTWILLSPQFVAVETATVTSDKGHRQQAKINESAFQGTPGREALRRRPQASFGFKQTESVESVEALESVEAIESVEPVPASDSLTVSIPSADSTDVARSDQAPVAAAELKTTGFSTPLAAISEAASLGRFEIRAASRIGSDHALLGDPRQDDYVVVQAADGKHLVVVVADGLGIAEHSHYGAYWATRLLAEAIDRNLRDGVPGIVNMLESTRDQIEKAFEGHFTQGTKLRSISTTLVGLIAPVDGGAGAGFRIGDSDILIDGANGWGSIFDGTEADQTAMAFPEVVDAEVVPLDLTSGCLLLATDGVTEPLAANQDLAATFSTQLANVIDEAAFCRLIEFGLETARGDRTAVAVWSV